MQSTSSHPATDDSTIIRTGSDGRLRYSPDQKQSLLAAFDRSGISAMAFARQHGVQYQTFIVWLRKRREQGPAPALDSSMPAFAEVLVNHAAHLASAGSLRIVLPCGAAIEITSSASLPLTLELLAALRRPC